MGVNVALGKVTMVSGEKGGENLGRRWAEGGPKVAGSVSRTTTKLETDKPVNMQPVNMRLVNRQTNSIYRYNYAM